MSCLVDCLVGHMHPKTERPELSGAMAVSKLCKVTMSQDSDHMQETPHNRPSEERRRRPQGCVGGCIWFCKFVLCAHLLNYLLKLSSRYICFFECYSYGGHNWIECGSVEATQSRVLMAQNFKDPAEADIAFRLNMDNFNSTLWVAPATWAIVEFFAHGSGDVAENMASSLKVHR